MCRERIDVHRNWGVVMKIRGNLYDDIELGVGYLIRKLVCYLLHLII